MGTLKETPTRPEYWIRVASEAFCIEDDVLLGMSRTKEIASYRHAAMWVARQKTGWSYPALARAFHRGDHTTVMNAIERAESDEYIWPLIEEIFEYVEAANGQSVSSVHE